MSDKPEFIRGAFHAFPGLYDVLVERHEQIDKHGRTIDMDRIHNRDFEMADAAMAYITPPNADKDAAIKFWPWPVAAFKPKTDGTPTENYRKNLVKGIALALAELERLDEILSRKVPQ